MSSAYNLNSELKVEPEVINQDLSELLGISNIRNLTEDEKKKFTGLLMKLAEADEKAEKLHKAAKKEEKQMEEEVGDEQPLEDPVKLVTVDKNRKYFQEKCYTPAELRREIVEKKIFGDFNKIVKCETLGHKGAKKLRVTLQNSKGEIKIFPFMMAEYEDNTYINIRSVNYYASRHKAGGRADLKELLGE